jgi:diguanylate cyclase (GGDEF)-like protein
MDEITAWKSQEDELLALALESAPDPFTVDARLRALLARFGHDVYARFLHLICHVDVSPEEARRHWEAILYHTQAMAEGLGRPVDYRVGAADYFVRETPCIPYPAVIDIRIYQQTEQGVLKDPLTSLYNLRYLEEALPREMGISRRSGTPLTLIFLDVDHFKSYNDRLGHEAGNVALQSVAGVIRDSVRDMDLPCRYGGEEFTVLLPATDKLGGLAVASRIVQTVERLRLPAPSPFGVLTLSAGVASFPSDAADGEELVRHADAAMYQAKALGKNRALPYSYERRGYLRIPREFAGTAAENGRAALPLSGKNLSCSGLYFQLPTDVALGQVLDLDLDLVSGPDAQRISCRVRVVRCEAEGDGVFGIGAQIVHIPTGDRLRYFDLASAPPPKDA